MFQNLNAFVVFYLTITLFPVAIPLAHKIIDLVKAGASRLVAPATVAVRRPIGSLSTRPMTEMAESLHEAKRLMEA